MTIPTAYAAGTEPDSSELIDFLESLKTSEYAAGSDGEVSTLDKIEFFEWADPEDGFDVAKVDFTFTAQTAVTAESRRRRAVDDDTFAAVASDIEDDLEAALETLAKENDGGILPQDLDISEDDFSDPDITTEDEEPEYDTEVETEAAYDETFEVDDPTTCDDPTDLGLSDTIDPAAKEALECDVAANSGADEIGKEAADALAELSEIADLNPDIEAEIVPEAIATFVPGSETTTLDATSTAAPTTTVTFRLLFTHFTNRITLLTCDDVIMTLSKSPNLNFQSRTLTLTLASSMTSGQQQLLTSLHLTSPLKW